MKRIISILPIALSISDFIGCNGNQTNTDDATTQADTSIFHQTLAKDEIYICKMHNEVMSDKLGKCSICGMTLVKQKMTPEQQTMMKEGTYVKLKD